MRWRACKRRSHEHRRPQARAGLAPQLSRSSDTISVRRARRSRRLGRAHRRADARSLAARCAALRCRRDCCSMRRDRAARAQWPRSRRPGRCCRAALPLSTARSRPPAAAIVIQQRSSPGNAVASAVFVASSTGSASISAMSSSSSTTSTATASTLRPASKAAPSPGEVYISGGDLRADQAQARMRLSVARRPQGQEHHRSGPHLSRAAGSRRGRAGTARPACLARRRSSLGGAPTCLRRRHLGVSAHDPGSAGAVGRTFRVGREGRPRPGRVAGPSADAGRAGATLRPPRASSPNLKPRRRRAPPGRGASAAGCARAGTSGEVVPRLSALPRDGAAAGRRLCDGQQ